MNIQTSDIDLVVMLFGFIALFSVCALAFYWLFVAVEAAKWRSRGYGREEAMAIAKGMLQ